jgi:hypothetical protein
MVVGHTLVENRATVTPMIAPRVAPIIGIRSQMATTKASGTGNGTPSRLKAMSEATPAMIEMMMLPIM